MTQHEVTELTDDQLEAILQQRRAEKAKEAQLKRQAYENIKESTILSLCAQAEQVSRQLADFKVHAFEDMTALYNLLQEYSKRHKDGKGNFEIENADCTYRIEFNRQERGYFDERSNQAEKHIIEFVNRQFAGDPTTHKLITSLLERKKGALDIKLVQKLYAMETEYTDENWTEGIKLLKESWKPAETKDYIRFFKKVNGVYQIIKLAFSALPLGGVA